MYSFNRTRRKEGEEDYIFSLTSSTVGTINIEVTLNLKSIFQQLLLINGNQTADSPTIDANRRMFLSQPSCVHTPATLASYNNDRAVIEVRTPRAVKHRERPRSSLFWSSRKEFTYLGRPHAFGVIRP